uniref:Uncharacterized protein n=1 Tax=Cygnus columbianus CRESS-DNA-virus sp. TaxID=2815027 RepID=A0A8A4XAY6_9VIRU|nr:MAG: hypothetical protein [Cygnus columbianus CRESS-DNA-virus sp.]
MVTPNHVVPKNKKEAIIWNKYNAATWDWHPIRVWPRAYALRVIQSKLKGPDRFGLFLYFVGNGMSPEEAGETLQDMGRYYFDHKAKRRIEEWVAAPHKLSGYKYWDERVGAWVKFDPIQPMQRPIHIPKRPKRVWKKPQKPYSYNYPKKDILHDEQGNLIDASAFNVPK